jgi:predicted anti-sigma-YlaC factor YlaD
MTSAGCRDIKHALGVYVLGAIDPAERALVDEHLAICLDCREELAGLAGLPALLRKIPLAEAERLAGPDAEDDAASEEMLQSLLRRTARVRRARRLRGLVAAAAVVLVALGGGGFALNSVLSGNSQPAVAEHTWQTVTVSDSQTGAVMTVDYTPTQWGTLMKIQVKGITAGTDCQFVVTDAAGHRWTVGGWRLTYQGGPAWYPASTSVADKDLRTFELVSGKRVLAEVPVD